MLVLSSCSVSHTYLITHGQVRPFLSTFSYLVYLSLGNFFCLATQWKLYRNGNYPEIASESINNTADPSLVGAFKCRVSQNFTHIVLWFLWPQWIHCYLEAIAGYSQMQTISMVISEVTVQLIRFLFLPQAVIPKPNISGLWLTM